MVLSIRDLLKEEKGLGARLKARLRVAGFLRRRKYEILVKHGVPPEEAARRLGIKMPYGVRVREEEVLKKVEKGR